MKTTTRILALSLVLVMTVLAFASCGVNFDKAKEKLEDEKYAVVKLSADELISKAKTLGIEIDKDASIDEALIGTKLISNVVMIKFANSGDAKDLAEAMEGGIFTVVRKGSTVIIGDETAVNIVK